MMRLNNKRIVRLVGYERQQALIELVSQRIAGMQASATPREYTCSNCTGYGLYEIAFRSSDLPLNRTTAQIQKGGI